MAGRGGLDSVLRSAVQGVAGGIGLASESIHARKEKKRVRSNAQANENTSAPTAQPREEHAVENVYIDQSDEKQWDLDDAQQTILGGASSIEGPPEYPGAMTTPSQNLKPDAANITEAFIKRYPPPALTEGAPSLPLPIILPQRRPKDRTRGFIRAFAPELEVKGIDQAMFLDFLQTFEKASEASPWINAINLAGIATSFIPDGFGVSQAVGIAIQMSVKVAMDLQSRSRTNSFIDQVNDGFYRPRGLYCLVMTWSPESSEISDTFDLTSTISLKSKDAHSSKSSKFAKKFSKSSGTTYADMEFPEVAPLVYPALDNLAERQDEEAVTKREKLKQKQNFVGEYWDKRAQAKYIGKHPDSILAQTPKPTFTSRYADPNHPASSGSLISLVTGGHVNPPSLQEIGGPIRGGLGSLFNPSTNTQRNARTDLSGLGSHNSGPLGLPLPTPQTAIKKLLKKDVLYLMIVNMPSEAEMTAAMVARE